MTTIDISVADEATVEDFAGSLFGQALAAMELANVELGLRLGLYERLHTDGPRTSAELARSAGIVERYAREWLEQQAAAGVLTVSAGAPEEERRYELSTAHAHVLLDEDSEACMQGAAACLPWAGTALGLMVEEFRSGRGLAFGDFDLHDIQAAFTRPVFRHHLVQNWLPALPEVQARLDAGEPVHVAEVGCGEGEAALVLAAAYPNVTVDAFDLDEASILVARAAAEERGLTDRVTFHLQDAGEASIVGDYDLVLAIEMLHDVPHPVPVLRTLKRLAGSTGAVLVVDERAEDDFVAPASEMERFFYAFSTLHCLAVSMQDGGAGTGTVMRADTVRAYASAAGFAGVEVLDVDHPQFRLYRLSPS